MIALIFAALSVVVAAGVWAARRADRHYREMAYANWVDGCACCEAGCGGTADGDSTVCLICNH
jgi:cytochrome c oxidase assembly factor CtaG